MFDGNDAGPFLDNSFPSEDNAASLYILGGQRNSITSTQFINHIGNEDYYTSNVATNYGKYFPSYYYQYSHSPVVRIRVQPVANIEWML